MHALFDDNRSVYSAGRPPYEPLPPLDRDTSADIAIIGGGFTGVSTAYHLARRFPEKRIVILEARALGNGASGRNGGLVLNGVNGVHDTESEEAKRIYDVTESGIQLIETIIRDNRLDVSFRRNGCIDAYTDARRADAAARDV